MMSSLLWLTLLAAPQDSLEHPSVAVMRVRAQGGLTAETTELLTGALTSTVRAQKRFARVVSSGEIEAMLDFERQKQLADCNGESCMAELAGALGVDYLLSTTVGLLGDDWLINCSLIDVHKSFVVSSASRTVTAANRSVITQVFDDAVTSILDDARIGGVRGKAGVKEKGVKRLKVRGEGRSLLRPWMAPGALAACLLPAPFACCLGSFGSLAMSGMAYFQYVPLFFSYADTGVASPLMGIWCGLSIAGFAGAVVLFALAGLSVVAGFASGCASVVLAILDTVIGNLTERVEDVSEGD